MSAKNNIQDYILNTARKEKIELTIYLLNGVPLKGKVTSFDNFTIIIVTHSMQQAARVSNMTAFFNMGKIVEYDTTDKIFTNPNNQQTQDYITGRFG